MFLCHQAPVWLFCEAKCSCIDQFKVFLLFFLKNAVFVLKLEGLSMCCSNVSGFLLPPKPPNAKFTFL